MDRVVSSFSRGSCVCVAFNRHTVFCEPQDNRKITATFPDKYTDILVKGER